MTEKPLTDGNLDEMERHLPYCDIPGGHDDWVERLISEVRRLRSELANARSVVSEDTAELRRLRGDEWLEKAAEEVVDHALGHMRGCSTRLSDHGEPLGPCDGECREARDMETAEAEAILRKHRDGA